MLFLAATRLLFWAWLLLLLVAVTGVLVPFFDFTLNPPDLPSRETCRLARAALRPETDIRVFESRDARPFTPRAISMSCCVRAAETPSISAVSCTVAYGPRILMEADIGW